MWRKAMIHLGLGDDADYDEYHAEHGDEPEHAPGRDARHAPPARVQPPVAPPGTDDPSAIGAVRPITTRAGDLRESMPVPGQTVTPSGMGIPRPRPQVVRPVPMTSNAKPHVVVAASFNQAQEVADKFKGNQPVIMNLQGADRELSRRLIDFASGLCYGLGGQMERVANQVYLLTPSNVEVSVDERRRLHERGYDG